MELIKEWSFGLVLASIIGTLILVLAPTGSVEKQVKTAVSLFLLLVFVQPFLNFFDISSLNILEDISLTTAESIKSEEIISNQMEFELRSRLEIALDEIGIKADEINIDIVINDNGELIIEKVTVFTEEADFKYKDKIIKKIKESTEIIAEVEVK